MGERYPFPFPPSLLSLPFPPLPCHEATPRKPARGSGSSVSFLSGVRDEAPAIYAFLVYFCTEIAPGGIFFTNALRKTAVSARSAGSRFKNLHQQKFPVEFRISGGNSPRLYVWKKHCTHPPTHTHPQTGPITIHCLLRRS